MSANILKRLFVIAAVVALSLWAIYPLEKKVTLGLDLSGGVFLVLQVKTDQALERQTQLNAEQLRTALTDERVTFRGLDITGPTEFRVHGIRDEVGFRRVAARVEASFDRFESDGTNAFRMKSPTPDAPPAA